MINSLRVEVLLTIGSAVVGFARQHDCKRHMLLHEGLRPFECEGCGKKFARLDALTRHRECGVLLSLHDKKAVPARVLSVIR